MSAPDNRRAPASRHRDALPSNRQRVEPKKNESNGASPMHAERLKRLYAAMLKCRELDRAIRGEMRGEGFGHGLEAIISGAAIHLRDEDFVAPSPYRQFVYSIQGASLQAGPSTSEKAKSENAGTISSSNQLHLAAGMALACKLLKRPCVVLCLSKIGLGEDSWRSAVGFASSRKLPVVFVLAHSPAENQDAFAGLRSEAQQLLPAITVDGNDVVAVYRVAEESTRRARQGLGPSLIECRLERGRDPLLFMEAYLKHRNLWSDSWKQELLRNFARAPKSPQKSHSKAV